ncbi:MAG: hypothetical protein GF329_09805 [Candidatus Lokiarchaeota archaeon]|nr:hypothetical protein [Candidatus Lokiarchaeota archaeon]
MQKNHPLALIISDTHLGASGSRYKKFEDFLENIMEKISEENELCKNLQCIILLGDVFDLVCDSYKDISKDYKDIFELLDRFKEKNLEIIIVLGNHDISVRGDWDKTFNDRKKKLVKKFRKANFTPNFLKIENLCQYLLLSNDEDRWKLSLYNTSKIFDTEPFRRIKLSEVRNLNGFHSILLTHGHQFYPEKTRSAASVWEFCLGAPDFIKEIFNYIWNIALKNGKDPEKINIKAELNDQQDEIEKKFNLKLNSKKKDRIKKFSLKIKEIKALRESLKNSEVSVRSLLPKNLTLSRIIFGHTHQVEIFHKDNIEFINTGAWQHVLPSFTFIYPNGNIKIRILNENDEWEEYSEI